MNSNNGWVQNECYDNIDYVSIHRYYGNPTGDTASFLASTMDMDDFIRSVVSACDAVKGKKHGRKQVNLSFDEWNVWYHSNEQDKEIQKQDKWTIVQSPVYDCREYTDVPYVDAMAMMADDGSLTVFCLNRDPEEDCLLDLDLCCFGGLEIAEHIVLHHDDVNAVNTEENPDCVVPVSVPAGKIEGGRAEVCLKPLSWNVIRLCPRIS